MWPEWNLAWALGLLSATAVLLFVPKMLAVALVIIQGAERYGGRLRLVAGAALEILLSALLAPVRMLFHTQFVLSALTGLVVRWKSPPREDAETTWDYAARRHGWQALLGSVWLACVYALDPAFLRWLLPVAGALLVPIPISVLTSRVSPGRRLRQAGIFLIPEEAHAPAELAEVAASLHTRRRYPGFVDAVTDPRTNALLCGLRPARALKSQRLEAAPQAWNARERMRLLNDPAMLSRLHGEVRASAVHEAAWRRACADPAGRSARGGLGAAPLPTLRLGKAGAQ